MLIFVIGMRFFYGNVDTARKFLAERGCIRHLLSKSALNRKIHHIPTDWWEGILEFIQRIENKDVPRFEYIVDAFPVSVCVCVEIFVSIQEVFIKDKNLGDIIRANESIFTD